MSVNIVLLLVMGVMFAGGIYLLLERTLTRVLLGMILMTNATNLLILIMAGAPGQSPIVEDGLDPSAYTDPLPQALTLTSIVISFAITSFMLGMIYRSWKLGRRDEVLVDTEDLKVAEQPSFDAEDDAELLEETSEFLDEHEDPNADYEHATAINPATGSLPVRLQRDGTVRVRPQGGRQERSTRGGRRAAQEPEEGENPVGYRGHDDHLPDEDERAGSPRARPPRFPEQQRDDRKQDKRDDGPGARGRRRKGEG
jgi:multicomponent Na+:H+ antiporter subunit C